MRLPSDSQRLTIYGKTGSGKTVAGLWHLEKRNWSSKRWEILDIKRDSTIGRIPRLEEIDISAGVGKQPGLYVRRPLPGQHEEIERFLWRCWERRNVGIMIDEAYEIPKTSRALRAVLTQGRSLHVPMINLTQRPAWLSPFMMSETDFHQVFFMQNPADIDRINEWVPGTGALGQDYHSYYYDVAKNDLTYLKPVPPEDEILDRFDHKMPRKIHLFRGITSNAVRARKPLT
jgi:hypothetical protein